MKAGSEEFDFNVAERKRQAFALRVRGNSPKTIAKLMGISEATVRRYLDEHKDELKGTAAQINRDDYVSIAMERFDQLRKEAWTNYDKAEKLAEKGRFLKLLLDINLRETATLLDLGCIERQAVHHEHALVDVDNIDMAKLDALAASITAGTLGVSPEQALLMGRSPFTRISLPDYMRPPSDEIVGRGYVPVTHLSLDQDEKEPKSD